MPTPNVAMRAANALQAGICEAPGKQLARAVSAVNPDMGELGTLEHASSARALVTLLGARATPRTRMASRGAGRQPAQVPRVRPSEETSDG